MTRLVPYPVLTAGLVLMWLLLNRFSVGHLLLGSAVALIAGRSMSALRPAKPRIRRWDKIPRLIGVILFDIARSNLAVATLILTGGRHHRRRSGFIEVPLELHQPAALALLAVIITATPGTAWMQYDPRRDTVLLHVFDLVDEADWIKLVKGRYESMLLEIFE
jgi:multicomponent K+:H+ antiporter subunit E